MTLLHENIHSTDITQVFETQRKQALKLRTEPLKKRIKLLKAVNAWIHKNRKELREAVFKDMGKPGMEFEGVEILYVLNEIRTALKKIKQWAAPKLVEATFDMMGTKSSIYYEPKGVCLIISPWNYPFSLAVGPLISALAAGNTVIIKPSEFTPNMSKEIERMVSETFNTDTVAVIQGDASIGKELLKLPFDHIFFTGSPAVGKAVMKAAADNLTSVTLELGGKCPALVSSKASLKDAAQRIAVAKFVNAGQTCVAPDYVLVDKTVESKFIELLIQNVKSSFGAPNGSFKESESYGRIIHQRNFTRLNNLLENAVNKHWKVQFSGDHKAESLLFAPTIITGSDMEAIVMKEEIFGPILPVIPFSSIREAIEMINSKHKPLGLYMFSSSGKEKEMVLKETSSGGVCINDSAIQFLHHTLPFGGVNHSGMGKSHGHAGFLAFSNEKPVLRQRNGFTSVKLFYPPYTKMARKLLELLMKLFYR